MTEDGSPLTVEQRQALQDGQARARSFMGAAKVAAVNGWTVGGFAAVSILSGLFSPVGFIIGLGLAVVARNEFSGRSKLRGLDPAGLDLLWRNQLGLMALIVGYCVWSMVQTVTAPDPQMAELTDLLGEGTGELVQSLTLTVYGAVVVATAAVQGLNARYYYVRVERVRQYLSETPPWIVDLQRSTSID